MDESTTLQWLAKAIEQATKSARFCVAGSLPIVDPDIAVVGLGPIKLPLKGAKAKALVASCQVAPYGKGTRTLVNKKVRDTFELDPKMFRLSEAWNVAIARTMGPVAQQLGLPAEQLEARLYKLLVYERGGFFLPHRDSEKHDRMVASMVVVLPNPFEGGSLVVRHGAAKQTLKFEEAAAGKVPCYAAFYADCEHEVQSVTRGVRLCLAYNLVLKAQPSVAAKPAAPADTLSESIGSWVAQRPTQPLVFALEHHYTERGLALDLLKGADRTLADIVVAAAANSDCLVHLAQVTRHLLQYADDGSFEEDYESRYRRAPRRAIEIGETYEDDLNGTEWTDIRGKKQSWKQLRFDPSAIVASVPLDKWKPTSKEYEGYTGNEGNTLDRWYHRSAIVIWHRDHHFDVVARAGMKDSIPLFRSMTANLPKTPKKRLETARGDCIRFARAIVACWPTMMDYWHAATEEKSQLDEFPKLLLMLHDRDTIALFLTTMAQRDPLRPLQSFVLAASRAFGWTAFAEELKQLILARPNEESMHPSLAWAGVHRWQEIAFRDVEWLSAFCRDKTADSDKSALAHALCALAVDRFCEPRPPRSAYYERQEGQAASASEQALPLLLMALAASGCDEDLARVIRFVQASPDDFNLDDCQVPCLKTVVPWTRQHCGLVHPHLASWLASVRQQLESATATQPAPPTDWARPAEVTCTCQYCGKLNAFLADPTNSVGRIAAREDIRQHVIGSVHKHRCDVTYTLERKGSPHSLLLKKTNGSFDRAVKRFEANRKLLGALPDEE